jgi:hypothetical protein
MAPKKVTKGALKRGERGNPTGPRPELLWNRLTRRIYRLRRFHLMRLALNNQLEQQQQHNNG